MKRFLFILFFFIILENNSFSTSKITTYECKEVSTIVNEDNNLEIFYRDFKAATLIVEEDLIEADKWGSTIQGKAKFIYNNYSADYLINYGGYGDSFSAYKYQKIDDEFIKEEKDEYIKKIWKKNKGKIYSAGFLEFQPEFNNKYFYLDRMSVSLWTLETNINQVSGSNDHFKCREIG